MVKKCNSGLLCLTSFNIILIVIIIFGCLYHVKTSQNTIIIQNTNTTPVRETNSVLLNPFKPPLKKNQYLQEITYGLPINIPTQGFQSQYNQMGILTRINGPETILPLMGRTLITNKNKWQYYTISDQNNQLKLPVIFNGKSCTGDYGCDDLSNGDIVYVEGYNDAFKATIYENNSPKYIPFI